MIALVGKNIKYIRESQSLTQEQFGRLLSIQKTTLSSYECGKREVSLETLYTISELFKISIDELVKTDLLEQNFQIPDLNLEVKKANTIEETSPYHENMKSTSKIAKLTEQQISKRLIESYKALDYEDKFLLTKIAVCFQSHSKYQTNKKNIPAKPENK